MRTVAILSLLLACCHTNKSINMRRRVRRKRFEPRSVSESGPKLFPHKQENIIPLKDAPAAEIQRNKRRLVKQPNLSTAGSILSYRPDNEASSSPQVFHSNG